MTPSLDDLFKIVDQTMKDEILHGDDPDGPWELRRFDVQVYAFSAEGKYSAQIRDWKRVMTTGYQPGDELSFGYADTPAQALYDAMNKFELLPEELVDWVGRD